MQTFYGNDALSCGSRPVLFIGLDGAEPDLIRQWASEGALPTLERLCREGIYGDLGTLPGMGDGATWPSVITGVNPARHGRYFISQFKPRSYRKARFRIDTDLKYQPFWSHLSQAGRRVAVLDIPYTPLDPDINGVLLVDWLIHDRYGEPRSRPQHFVNDLLHRFGDDPISGNSDKIRKDGESLKWLCDCLSDRVHMKEALVTETLGKGPWDLLATVFAEPHDAGHVAWHFHDKTHPQHDPDWLARYGDPIKKLYIEIDQAIGRIVAKADPDATVIVFIGLGMGPDYTANAAVEKILHRLEGKTFRKRSIAKWLKSSGKSPRIVRLGAISDTALGMYSMSRRKFYAMPHNENSGAIRINLKGREPLGVVPPEAYDAVCGDLTEAFMGIANTVTGKPVVDEVVRVSNELDGEMLDAMPDLFVVWSRDAPIESIESPRIGVIGGISSWGRTGDHTPHAMLIVHGEAIGCGELKEKSSIVDIAPTITALQGVKLSGIDGRVIKGIFPPR